VLYPSRPLGAEEHAAPPDRLRAAGISPVAFYAGNIYQPGYWRSLQRLAEALGPVAGKLVLYTPYSRAAAANHGLVADNVECRAMVRWDELVDRIRAEAQFLYLPMSFDPPDRANAVVSFPSKLVDYLATGVPVLIHGPEYSSAVRWATDHPESAEVVGEMGGLGLAQAVERLARDGEHRFRIGQKALAVGRGSFSHAVVEQIFFQHLRRTEGATHG
jgi:hypothetical protein